MRGLERPSLPPPARSETRYQWKAFAQRYEQAWFRSPDSVEVGERACPGTSRMLPTRQRCALPAPARQNFGVPATRCRRHLDRPEARSELAMEASLDVRTWLRTSMSILLGFPCDEVADYVLTLPSLDTMREHIESFAGEMPSLRSTHRRQAGLQLGPARPATSSTDLRFRCLRCAPPP